MAITSTKRFLRTFVCLLTCVACCRTVRASETAWVFTGGAGRSSLRADVVFAPFGLGADSAAALTMSAQRSFLGFLRTGLRISYVGFDTPELYYCRYDCYRAYSRGRTDLLPMAVTAEAYWSPVRIMTLHAGAGVGPIWAHSKALPPELYRPDATSLRTYTVAYGGLAAGSGRFRPRLDVAWHRFSRVEMAYVSSADWALVSGLEVALSIEIRR